MHSELFSGSPFIGGSISLDEQTAIMGSRNAWVSFRTDVKSNLSDLGLDSRTPCWLSVDTVMGLFVRRLQKSCQRACWFVRRVSFFFRHMFIMGTQGDHRDMEMWDRVWPLHIKCLRREGNRWLCSTTHWYLNCEYDGKCHLFSALIRIRRWILILKIKVGINGFALYPLLNHSHHSRNFFQIWYFSYLRLSLRVAEQNMICRSHWPHLLAQFFETGLEWYKGCLHQRVSLWKYPLIGW